MHCLIQKFAVAFSLLIILSFSDVTWADLPVRKQHAQARDVNAARADFLQARLQQVQWQLDRLKELQQHGHATWLEVRRAEANHRQLQSQLISARQMSDFLEELARRLPADDDSVATEPPTIALQMPGSTRLIGWLPPDALTDDQSRLFLAELHADHQRMLGLAKSMLEASTMDLDRLRAREQKLNKIHAAEPQAAALQRARLAVTTAEAEHKFARAAKNRHQQELDHIARCAPARPLANGQSQLTPVSLPTGARTFLSAADDRKLQQLTQDVATLEANADGQLAAAEILLQRRSIRLEALRKLKADGFATPVELKTAERLFAVAQKLVDQIRAQQAGLRDSLLANHKRQYAFQLTRHRTSAPQGKSLAIDQHLASLPPAACHDGSVVRRLISLYWETCEAEAERALVTDRLKMHREVLQRLEAIQSQTTVNARELEFAELDVRYDEAVQQAARERLEILVAEQKRFACQLQLQFRGGEEFSAVMVAFAEPAALKLLRHARENLAPLVDAQANEKLQQPDSHLFEPGLVQATTRRAGSLSPTRTGLDFEPDRFRMPADLLASLSRTHPYPALRTLDDYRQCAGDSLFVRRNIFNESYSSCYAFGIRRIYVDGHRVWHSRSNSYGAPWYLPGSPTNFR